MRPSLPSVCLIALCLSLAATAQTSEALTRFTFTEYLMGVDARIVAYAPDRHLAETACAAAFERIAALENVMSDYRKDSELMRLSAKAGQGPVKISPDLFKVLQRSQEMSQRTDGMFDITVGPLVQLWRKARKTGVLPTPSAIREARALVGWQKIVLDPHTQSATLLKPGMKLDLGAIGKGFADDEAQIVLKAHGITRALVDMGGDIVFSGPPPGKKGWTVKVPAAATVKGTPELQVSNCAVSTSGDAEQNVVIGGVRYSHVVNPKTGMALTHSVQATVICPDGLTSDPLSTSLTLLDERGRKRLLRFYPGVKAYVGVVKKEE